MSSQFHHTSDALGSNQPNAPDQVEPLSTYSA